FNTIHVLDHAVELNRYTRGHSSRDYGDKEMDLIQALLMHPDLQLVQWTLSQGGDGVLSVQRQGTDRSLI
ncbi:hypothetical protein BVX98_01275, partial [bacterium F11]